MEEVVVTTRSFARWVVLAIASFALIVSCGRSNIDDYVLVDGGVTFDGGPDGGDDGGDAGRCNAQTCPSGCCDANDQCQGGNSYTSCGNNGAACTNCQALGFQVCDPQRKACANQPQVCDARTCPTGCCDNGRCFSGADQNECGNFGQQCQHCAAQGQQCQGQVCRLPTQCGPSSCPGCCEGNVCVPGFAPNACGSRGQQCQNCTQFNETCVGTPGGAICEPIPPPPCGPPTCPGGCCDQFGQCNAGTSDFACGAMAQRCVNCAQLGESCQFQTCQTQVQCNAQTCPGGCCQGNVCVGGGSNTACGRNGQQCQDCQSLGEVCNGGGQCTPPPPLCNPSSCPSGCCTGDVCAIGTQDSACGTGGAQCRDCTSFNDVCSGQACVPRVTTCTPQNCAGCCDASGTCQAGFLDNQCGQGGAACANCSAQMETCNTTASPRACTMQTMTCPAPFAGCSPGDSTPWPPVVRGACSATDLANARNACNSGAHTAACDSFFSFESTQKPACASCLTPFQFDFQQATAIFSCVAPFVSVSCDATTGCATECETKSCAMCPTGSQQQCEQQVQNGQCSREFQAGVQCAGPALFGAASFCNPQNYGGNYGAWLQGVGGHYCGP
jgi:hypothetical protein